MATSKKAIAAFISRDFASFEWMKRLSREALLREMAQFKVPPEFKTEPWLHQLVCHYIGCCEPRFLFLLDMGLGKSKIISDLAAQAQREKKLRRALIMVPRLVNIDSWLDDLARHSDLEPNPVMVENIEEKRYRLLHPVGDITVVDYMGLQWALCNKVTTGKGKNAKTQLVPDPELVARAQKLYNFVGIDESHKLRNPGNLWFSLVSSMTEHADRVYATTGTLFGKSPEELWPQFKLVDRGETFGETKGLFHGAFFTAKPHPFRREPDFVYDKSQTRLLNKMIAHRSIRYDEDEVTDLPQLVRRKIVMDMAPDQNEHYLRALEGVINSGGDPRALEAPWLRMRQMTSGYLKWRDANGDHMLPFKHNPKLEMLVRLVDEANHKVVVCYDYTDTGAMICKRLKAEGIDHEWFYGGTKNKPASRRRFLEDPDCKVFVMNSEAGGTGNDGLQKVARYMVFFESPTPVITRKQTEKRIHRPGLGGRAFVFDLVMRKTVDAGILGALSEGRDLYDDVMKGGRGKSLLRGLLSAG